MQMLGTQEWGRLKGLPSCGAQSSKEDIKALTAVVLSLESDQEPRSQTLFYLSLGWPPFPEIRRWRFVAQSCPTLCHPVDHSCQAALPFTISRSLLKLMSIES